MEKKKNNKKLFAIIAASALAFVLTIALSVSITLAYFGDAKKSSAVLVMGNKITVDSASTVTTELNGVLPGVAKEVQVKGVVTSKPETSTESKDSKPTPCFIRLSAKAVADELKTADTTALGADEAITFKVTKVTVASTEADLAKDTAGNFYVVNTKLETEEENSVLKPIDTTTDVEVIITFTVTPNAKLTNLSANKKITVNFEISALQAIDGATIATAKTYFFNAK